MKKRLLLATLSVLLLWVLVGCGTTKEVENGNYGAVMTVEEFHELYVGEDAPCPEMEITKSSPTISYHSISYEPETRKLSFEAEITREDTVFNLKVIGTMYSSDKKDHGINSVVGDVQDSTGQVEVLRFEIYNDDDFSLLRAINTDVPSTPVVLFYFLKENDLFLFETEIPVEMQRVAVADDCRVGVTEGHLDGFWFQSIVEPIMSVRYA